MQHSTSQDISDRSVTLPEMLGEALSDETRYDKRWCSTVRKLSRAASALGIASLILFAVLWLRASGKPLQTPLLMTALILVCIGFQTEEIYHNRKRKQGRLINKLQNHASALAPAMQLVHPQQDEHVLKEASQVLRRHLPDLTEKDYPCFTSAQRASLCFLVSRRNQDPDLALAAVKALSAVGDEAAAPALRGVLRAPGIRPDMAVAAASSLQAIARRSVQRRQARTLLRAGASVEAVSESLLRSCQHDNGQQSEQLVRAANR